MCVRVSDDGPASYLWLRGSVTESPADVSDQALGEVDQAGSDPARVHQVACQDEERNGEKGKAGGPGVHPLWNHHQQIGGSQRQKAQDGRQAHADGDGYPQEHQEDQQSEDRGGKH